MHNIQQIWDILDSSAMGRKFVNCCVFLIYGFVIS